MAAYAGDATQRVQNYWACPRVVYYAILALEGSLRQALMQTCRYSDGQVRGHPVL